MNKDYIIKIGLAYTILYANIESLLHPIAWIGWVPTWVTNVGFTPMLALQVHAVVAIILAIVILMPGRQRIAAWLIAIDLLGIIVFSGPMTGTYLVTFRDVGLLAMAVYLGVA